MGEVVSFYSGEVMNGVSVEDIELGKAVLNLTLRGNVEEMETFVKTHERFIATLNRYNGVNGWTHDGLLSLIDDEDFSELERALEEIYDFLFS